MRGRIYYDGSRMQCRDPDITRAAWAAVEVDENGAEQARLVGPVWAGLPQTAQSAEYAAWASAIQILDGPTTLYGDCLNVVNDAKKRKVDALKHNRTHAGAQHMAREDEGLKWVTDDVWVKAHRGITADVAGDQGARQGQ